MIYLTLAHTSHISVLKLRRQFTIFISNPNKTIIPTNDYARVVRSKIVKKFALPPDPIGGRDKSTQSTRDAWNFCFLYINIYKTQRRRKRVWHPNGKRKESIRRRAEWCERIWFDRARTMLDFESFGFIKHDKLKWKMLKCCMWQGCFALRASLMWLRSE